MSSIGEVLLRRDGRVGRSAATLVVERRGP
jgi:hypothetical protein